jgi:response regulator RpfG family c-di-GMP phosphodiesterase
MTTSSPFSDTLLFAPEDVQSSHPPREQVQGWKVLIVDDESVVHEVTRLVLQNFEYEGRGLHFLNAHSAREARELLAQHPDIAMAMVDVVMESEHAGLDLIRYIREELKNTLIRLVLRTGQPGQAPERVVIREYDINDYKAKTELTAQKLFTTVMTSLRSYNDLAALEANRRGLERVIQASGAVFQIADLGRFIQGVMEQLVALLHLGSDALFLGCDCLALENKEEHFEVLAATGQLSALKGDADPRKHLDDRIGALLDEALAQKKSLARGEAYVGYFQPRPGREDVIYVTSPHPLSDDDIRLLDLFLHNVSIAYENALLRDEIEGTQRDMVYMLGEAIETRSRETGQHVRRVAEFCHLIGLGMGLSEREAEVLHIAAPLHDFGKIGIPDAILHKPGELEADEWVTMQTHSSIGQELLGRSRREILQAAASLAGTHHERWDGSGYPQGLAGEAIPLYGRIGAVADVFDALAGERCYKKAWPTVDVFSYFQAERGKHFDPAIVDWVLSHRNEMLAVLAAYPDVVPVS